MTNGKLPFDPGKIITLTMMIDDPRLSPVTRAKAEKTLHNMRIIQRLHTQGKWGNGKD